MPSSIQALRRWARACLRDGDVSCAAGDCHTASAFIADQLRRAGHDAHRRTGSVYLAHAPACVMAHSWVEVALQDGGRLAVDPTAHQLAEEGFLPGAPALGVWPSGTGVMRLHGARGTVVFMAAAPGVWRPTA